MARSVGSGQFFSSIPEARTLGSRGEPGRAGSSLKLVSSLLTRPTELTLLNSHSTLTAAPEAKRKAIGTCAQLFFPVPSLPLIPFSSPLRARLHRQARRRWKAAAYYVMYRKQSLFCLSHARDIHSGLPRLTTCCGEDLLDGDIGSCAIVVPTWSSLGVPAADIDQTLTRMR